MGVRLSKSWLLLGSVLSLFWVTFLQAGTIQQNLVVHLPFDGDDSETTGRGVNPTPFGSPTFESNGILGSSSIRMFSSAKAPDPGSGQSQFNFVSLGDDTEGVLNFGEFTDFAVSFWVRAGSNTGLVPIVGNRDWRSPANSGWGVALGSDGRLIWYYLESSNDAELRAFESAPHLIEDSQWHHVAVSFQRSGDALTFLDGVQIDDRLIAQLDDEGNPIPGVIDSGFAVVLGQDGTGSYWDSNLQGSFELGLDDLGIWQRALNPEEAALIYTFGQRGKDLDHVLDSVRPFISSETPFDGDSNANPNGLLEVVLQDSFTSLVESSLNVFLDELPVKYVLTLDSPGVHRLRYLPPQLLPPDSPHHYQLVFLDNGSPPTSQIIDAYFTVGHYRNYILPQPIWLEDFDGTALSPLPEGMIPDGWSVENISESRTPTFDLDDKSSDTYLDWAVITGDRATNMFGLNRGFIRNWQVVNGEVLTHLIDGQFCYANSGGRPGVVYQVLYSPDIDLTTQSNVFLVYHSIYTQNQDSMGSVEYSVDQGETWQPVVYMLDGTPSGDIIRTLEGAVDAAQTLSTPQRDAPHYLDPNTGENTDGSFGSFIGVLPERFGELGPYISARLDDDQVESKRVEFFRLPLADHKPKVRLRFMNCGTDSWYFGIDHVGLYSIQPPVPDLTMNPVGNSLYLDWGPFGMLQSAPAPEGPWSDLTAVDHQYVVPTSVEAQFFRVVAQ